MKNDIMHPRMPDGSAAVWARYAPGSVSWIIAGASIVALVAALLFYTLSDASTEELKIHTAQGVHTFIVEIADTSATRSKGLMGRTHLAENAGMLFRYGKPRELRMWMKDTPLSLDMVFIRTDGTVHRIEARTQPFSEAVIFSQGEVLACLELLGGTAQRVGLKAGDRIESSGAGGRLSAIIERLRGTSRGLSE